MTGILYSILGFVLAIGLLTAIHEYGHFWTARRLGVKVLRFSIGFGKVLFSWHDKSGTEYALCAIPLGGYVKMLDQNEGEVAVKDLPHAYNTKPVWKRMLIIAAGPISNLLFAVLAYWLVFMWGISAIVPIIGEVPKDTVAYRAGLHSGQEITAVDGNLTQNWEDIILAIVPHLGEHDDVQIAVKDIKDQTVSNHTLELKNWNLDEQENVLLNLGLVPYDPLLPIVGKVLDGYPAQKIGLQAGDQIISLDGHKIANVTQLLTLLQDKYDQVVPLVIERKNQNINFVITPAKKESENGAVSGFIGIQFAQQAWPAKFIRLQRLAPIPALSMAVERTKEYTVLTLQFLGKMVTGKMSLQHISGPIAIAQYAGVTVRSGFETFMGFLALVSVSLGVLNMLPIPVLDGGHFLFCIIELIRGKALSMRAMNVGLAIGFVFLGGIMFLAIYNDVLRLL